MKIENLKVEDIKNCLDIYNYYILNTTNTLEEDALSIDSFKNRCLSIQKEFPFIVIKNDNDQILGYAYLHKFHERSAYRRTVELSIYVSKDHLKEHIGTMLLEQIEKLAKDLGYTNIISIITSENIGSIKFHEKHGYLLEGHLKNVAFKFNRDISVYYYRKHI